MKKTVKELAQFLGGTVIGDENREISDVKGLAEAGSDDISFAVEPYTEYLPQVHAGAVITEKEYPAGNNTLVLVENPRLAFSKLLELFHPRQSVQRAFILRLLSMRVQKSAKIQPLWLMRLSVKMYVSVQAVLFIPMCLSGIM